MLGAVGEGLLNLSACQSISQDLESIPAVTRFFLINFNLNSGYFMLSFTPFMLFMFGCAVVCRKNKEADLYWFFFVGVWLLVIIYFLLFLLALLAPFQFKLSVIDYSPVPTVVWTINMIILISFVGILVSLKLKHKKSDKIE